MAQTILSPIQQTLLTALRQERTVTDNFYLSGGTALAEYYLHHRYSEDLDFFSFEEVPPMAIQVVLKKLQKQLAIQKIDYQQSFNRNLFFLHYKEDVVKTEFTYYPFSQLEESKRIGKLRIDSLLDIAVNKVFTIYQSPRSRDFIDLYLILLHKQWSFADLRKKARLKFDTQIDPLQMAKQLFMVQEVTDYPRLLNHIPDKKWQTFWLTEAEQVQDEVLI